MALALALDEDLSFLPWLGSKRQLCFTLILLLFAKNVYIPC